MEFETKRTHVQRNYASCVCPVSGTDKGLYGCVIWVKWFLNANIDQVLTISPSTMIAKLTKPSHMYVSVCAQVIRCDFFVLHAPHKVHTRQQVDDFWDEVEHAVEGVRELGVQLVLGADANATIGDREGGHQPERRTTWRAATKLLKDPRTHLPGDVFKMAQRT